MCLVPGSRPGARVLLPPFVNYALKAREVVLP